MSVVESFGLGSCSGGIQFQGFSVTPVVNDLNLEQQHPA